MFRFGALELVLLIVLSLFFLVGIGFFIIIAFKVLQRFNQKPEDTATVAGLLKENERLREELKESYTNRKE